jgi:hypothetical protein
MPAQLNGFKNTKLTQNRAAPYLFALIKKATPNLWVALGFNL